MTAPAPAARPYPYALKVRFAHCDPAGIVFYPRYLEMVNEAMETFFEEVVAYPYAQMHLSDGVGVPTISLSAEFVAPSRIGDDLVFDVSVLKIGRTSLTVRLDGRCGDEARLSVTKTIVFMRKDTGRPIPWTEPMRVAFARHAVD
ncbi:MAG: thioesterase family protein [Pseudomonadota bacterium]